MTHTFTDPDLIELDRTWPIGQMLEVEEDGNIMVAGAYYGRYIHYLNEMFPTANIVGYEPQPHAFETIRKRFLTNPRILIKEECLGTCARKVELSNVGKDGASTLDLGGAVCKVTVRDIVEEVYRWRERIDLFLLNAEGSEWALLPYLLDEMMHHRIASIALQQHTKYASKERIARVKAYLGEYYDLVFDDGKVDGWSFWRRK